MAHKRQMVVEDPTSTIVPMLIFMSKKEIENLRVMQPYINVRAATDEDVERLCAQRIKDLEYMLENLCSGLGFNGSSYDLSTPVALYDIR